MTIIEVHILIIYDHNRNSYTYVVLEMLTNNTQLVLRLTVPII
jgi:hypothetical protein